MADRFLVRDLKNYVGCPTLAPGSVCRAEDGGFAANKILLLLGRQSYHAERQIPVQRGKYPAADAKIGMIHMRTLF